VFSYQQTKDFLTKVEELLAVCLPSYVDEGKTNLVIAIGCTGGKHRSVTMANLLAAQLEQVTDLRVLTYHRDLGRE